MDTLAPAFRMLDKGVDLTISGEDICLFSWPIAFLGDMPQQNDGQEFRDTIAIVSCLVMLPVSSRRSVTLTLNMEKGVHETLTKAIEYVIEMNIIDQALESVLTTGRGNERMTTPESTRWTPDVSWRRHDVLPIVHEGVVEVANTQSEGSLQRDVADWFDIEIVAENDQGQANLLYCDQTRPIRRETCRAAE
ncbi:hypothetical protein KEM56_005034 [Ascosphaera pollenicola]|nr:hypothetical protein KEM56_005034 [Ascosphaera pollenicola]